MNALANDISSIGAGGGSLVAIGSAGEIQVGPGNAGADPGPACYGRGGRYPTTTDTCLMIGIIDPASFAGGRLALDPDLSRQAFENLDSDFSLAQRVRYAYEMAVHNIAEGVFNVAIKKGVDPRDYSLVAAGRLARCCSRPYASGDASMVTGHILVADGGGVAVDSSTIVFDAPSGL